MHDLPADAPEALARWLASPESDAAQSAATTAIATVDLVAAGTHLRRARPELSPTQASAALEQADLRQVASARYGIDASRLLLTRGGLEQGTRPEVASHRAALLRAAGATRVLDLTAGLGFDTSAFVAAGLEVTAVERDPVTARFLAHNCPGARIVHGDGMAVARELLKGLDESDVIFVDPARRDPAAPRDANLRARPERDPARWSPPWSVIAELPHPRIAAKVAPSFSADGWHAEWVSVQRTVVECALYSWSVFADLRRAAIWTGSGMRILGSDDGARVRIAPRVGSWLHEPDPAIVRAGVVASLANSYEGLETVGESSTWLTSAGAIDDPVLRSYPVLAELVGSARDQRRLLDSLGIDSLTVKSRDVDVSPSTVLRELGRREGARHVIVTTRRGGRVVRFACGPARRQSA